MRATVAGLCLSLAFGSTACLGQEAPISSTEGVRAPDHPFASTVYCAGFYTTKRVSDETRLVTGEQSEYKVTFSTPDVVFLSKGSNQGVKPGDRFSVVREDKDPLKVQFFKWQDKLTKAMGTYYVDLGEVEVVKVQPNLAIGRVAMSCDFMQRGDIVVPFAERPAGPYKDASNLDSLAPESGRPVAMVVRAKDAEQMTGKGNTIYVNLGAGQGAKVGDYFRIFRYQGSHDSSIPIQKDYQDGLWGFGSNPKHYQWNDLPREVLGEGIVLNVSQNSSTVFVTTARREVYAGDYVELE